ncbi:v-type g subunit [Nannochloropsis oceanica]
MASGGMAELRAAEQKAAQIVQEARAARGERLKEATVEARRVIEGYRAEKEEQFQEFVKTKYGTSGSQTADLDRQTETELAKLSADFKQNKEAVLSVLVDKVTNVNVDVPEAWGVCTKY